MLLTIKCSMSPKIPLRLAQWCEDANNRQKKITYKMLYVKQEEWDKYKPKNWIEIAKLFESKSLSKTQRSTR